MSDAPSTQPHSHTSDPGAYDYTLYYNKWGVASPEQLERQVRSILEEMMPVLPSPSDEPVLDVGCGGGSTIRALIKHGFRDARGIDVDRGQVEACTKAGLNVSWVTDTLGYLRDHASTFRVIVLRDVFEHIATAEQIPLCIAVRHALLPGGVFVLRAPNASNPASARWLYGDYTHHSAFTEHSLDFILRNAGFSDIRQPPAPWLGRFPIAFWKRGWAGRLRRWVVRTAWKQAMAAELGGDALVRAVPMELNMIVAAVK